VKKRFRLIKQRDFTRLVRGRRLYAGRSLIAFAARSERPTRIGVTSSRDIKGAVARNRARRRLREVSRQVLLREDSPLRGGGISYDVVLIARTPALELPMPELEAEARSLLDRLRSTS
jgi:ribonuclease P protein component